MQRNRKNVLYCIRLILTVITLILGVFLIRETAEYTDEATVSARIVNISEKPTEDTDALHGAFYVTYAYTYNGKGYKATRREYSISGLNSGDFRDIKVRDKDHLPVNTYKLKAEAIVEVVLILFTILVYTGKGRQIQ